MCQRHDLPIADDDELMDELIAAIHRALSSDLDRHVLAGLLLEGAVQAIAQIAPGEAQTATKHAFIALALARFDRVIAQ